jgi:hypothetical protein
MALADDSAAGKIVRCQTCGEQIQVPQGPTPTPPVHSSVPQPQHRSYSQPAYPQPQLSPRAISTIGCLTVIVVFGVILAFSSSGSRKAEEQRREALTPEQRAAEDKAKAEAEKAGDKYEAMVMAERFAKAFLKYPDDAEFVPGQDAGLTDTINGQRHWVIDGKVKAANALGAKLTHTYSVQLYYKGNGVWQPRAIAIDDEQVFYEH